MAKKKKRKHGIKPDLPIIIDYGSDLVSVYDPVSVMPYSEPPITERTRYKKLNAEQKTAFKSMFVSAVTSYWNENRLIPFGEDMADIRKWRIFSFRLWRTYLFCNRCCSSGSDWMRCNSSATICRTSARMRL